PACGSGNFLYVAYREMRRLEAEVKRRLVERTRGGARAQDALSYVTPDHFLGLDNNAFAVEVAKVTMTMAKKLAADELDENVDALPLDDLDDVIRHADALFDPWPRADVIIGNPPYLGRQKMVEELGAGYCSRLAKRHPGVSGFSDFVTYWFPLAHEALPEGGRCGFVATQGIRASASRDASLGYVVDHGGIIFDAVSTQPWSGDAVVAVSIVNWVKGAAHAPAERVLWLDEGELRLPVEEIPPTLRAVTDVRKAAALPQNKRPKRCFQGQTIGNVKAYRLSAEAARELVAEDPGSAPFIHPFVSAKRMLHSLALTDYVIDLPHGDALAVNREAPGALAHLRAQGVLTERQRLADKQRAANAAALAEDPHAKINTHHIKFVDQWWQHAYRRADMLAELGKVDRYLALTRVAAEGRMTIFQFVDPAVRPDDSLAVLTLDDDYSFGVVSSSLHRAWFDERCSKMRVDPRYTPTTVWDSFPWPAAPDSAVAREVAEIGAAIVRLRERNMAAGQTLGAQYDALREPGKAVLRDLHADLDDAVFRLFGLSREDDLLAQILALNLAAAQDPESSRAPGGWGLDGARVSDYRLTAELL
ncbi:MAG: class I SAM-dependent DNA methyltransferase, partial [Nocardioidaceae bacterium]|nr:class I SAM-dependent DNA methyltransferase [Nocardioidaceae bacterium]